MVREAVAGDVDEVCAIAHMQPNAPRWATDVYLQMIDDVQRSLLVATVAGMVVGFIAVARVLDEAEIESIVVAPARERQGIGRMLCDAAMQWANVRGARCILLEVRAGSDAARAFYKAMGYEVYGVRRNYYDAPLEDAINMRLPLR